MMQSKLGNRRTVVTGVILVGALAVGGATAYASTALGPASGPTTQRRAGSGR